MIRFADDPSRWDRIVDESPNRYFSQLWDWGELQRSIGWEPWRLELVSREFDDGPPVAAIQMLVRRLPGTGWGIAHSSRGPVVGRTTAAWLSLQGPLTEWARENRIATLVFDTDVDARSDLGRALLQPPWKPAPSLGEPRCHVVDLAPEIDLWANVRRKHREWVRRAERADIDVRWSDHDSAPGDALIAIEHFLGAYGEIAHRIGIPMQAPDYYRQMWKTFRAGGRAQLVTATAAGLPLGAMLHLTCGDEMLWFAGGQAEGGADIGVGKLLVWQSMVRAQQLGYRRYNMWGTATDGLAHYKLGFGAREELYVGTRSMPVHRVMDRVVRAAWQGRLLSRRLMRS